MSEYDRRTGVKRLRVRGLKTVRFGATLKALGINLLRAAAVWTSVNSDPDNDKETGGAPNHVFSFVKEHFFAALGSLKRWLKDFVPGNDHMLITC